MPTLKVVKTRYERLEIVAENGDDKVCHTLFTKDYDPSQQAFFWGGGRDG